MAVIAWWSVNVFSWIVVREESGRGVWDSQWSRQVEVVLKVTNGCERAHRFCMESDAHAGGWWIVICKSPPMKVVCISKKV